MIVTETNIPEVKLIAAKKFGDERGFFSETFNLERYREAGISMECVQDNHSMSGPVGTVRGLHFQIGPKAQAKLVRVVRGAVLDVAVDIRKGSPTYGHHVAAVISAKDWNQLYIPRGFAHGFCTLEPDTEFLYKVDDYYSPEHERGIQWDDPDLGIAWPVEGDKALLSAKDTENPGFAALPDYFIYGEEG
jgi:dTDP-4-dehydrorhamnose 3,5-epimerase